MKGSRLCVFTSGSFAYDHFQLNDINSDFLFALGAKKRKIHQNGIRIHFGSCFAVAYGAANPQGYFWIVHFTPLTLYSSAFDVWLFSFTQYAQTESTYYAFSHYIPVHKSLNIAFNYTLICSNVLTYCKILSLSVVFLTME